MPDAQQARTTIVISDLHLGSRHCRCERFIRFLARLPDGAALVMNGDVVDRWHARLGARHAEAEALIRREADRREVIWVRGNHDANYVLTEPGRVQFAPSHRLGRRLYLAHGHDFDNLMPRNRTLINLFRWFHRVQVRLGAEPVHVAFYAKRFRRLYELLRRHVAGNAVEFARENGFEAVACGHTHFVEDGIREGIRYLNTGSWTEDPAVFLEVTPDALRLREVPD